MRRHSIFGIIIGALLLSVITSCKPDEEPIVPDNPTPINPVAPAEIAGVYHPGKKIKTIKEYKNENLDEEQVWNWENNVLTSIKYYWGGDYEQHKREITFGYQDDRLVRLDDNTDYTQGWDTTGWGNHVYRYHYITFEYDGNHLKRADKYENSALSKSWLFSYHGDKIDKISIEKSSGNYDMQLVWDGDNLIKAGPTHDGDAYFEYDSNNNPFYGFLGLIDTGLDVGSEFLFSFSKNNICKANSDDDYCVYTYFYDNDKYPTAQVFKNERICFEYE